MTLEGQLTLGAEPIMVLPHMIQSQLETVSTVFQSTQKAKFED